MKEESSELNGLVVCDTRGHIEMNEQEKEQFKIIVEGECKTDIPIAQKEDRDPLIMWELIPYRI